MSKRHHRSKKQTDKLKQVEKLVLEFMAKNTSKVYNYKQISKGIGYLNPRQREMVIKALHNLEGKNKLKEVSKGKYSLNIKVNDTLIGKIDFNQSGNAYVSIEGREHDIFVHQKNVKNALQGDTVLVVPFQHKNNKLEAAVVEVLERRKTQFVGTFEYIKTKDIGFVNTDRKTMNTDIFIPKKNFNAAEDGDKVIVKITRYEDYDKNPEGEIIKVLGRPGAHETEIHSILAEYGLPTTFPEEVMHEAEQIATQLPEEEIAKRRDMRQVLTFTIDPKDANDFDDALSLQKLQNGNWEVGVHIADVSHYVRPGSSLDEEAFARATSVYLVDRVVPMLPEILSNQLCSLRPEEDKFTFSAVFEIDAKAQVKKQWFGRTVIRSDRRFTYEEAQERIETKQGDWAEEILVLNELAKILRVKRMANGAIAFDREEVKFNLDEDKNPVGVYFKQAKDSNKLIEEFMLLANRKVSEFISLDAHQKPTNKTFIYRVHDNPDPLKLKDLKDFVATFGYKIDITNPHKIAHSLNQLLTEVKGKPEQNMIETLTMRSMSKAIYSTKNLGHFGLAFDYYSHFTSPIRRYPDVIAHRLLQHYLDGGKSVPKEEVEKKAEHCNSRERLASDAERDSIKFMQVKFMEEHVGEIFTGIISGVTEWGIYVEIPENGAEGLIRLRDLTNDSYYFDQKTYAVIGYTTGNQYRLGDQVDIKVVRANIIAKQLDFKMIE